MRYLFLCLILSSQARAADCFTEHITDALEQNKERRELYSKVSEGKSLSISNDLIRSERFAYFYSLWMMFRTRDLRKKGVPIFCSEFTPMSLTPAFKDKFSVAVPPPALSSFVPDPLDEIAKELKPHIENVDLEKIKTISLKWVLNSYKKEKRFNCMSRHVLESIYATAVAAESNFKKAKEVGVEEKTKSFTKSFLKGQVFGFFTLTDIDTKAAEIQAMNIPIVCNDAPAILDLDSFM